MRDEALEHLLDALIDYRGKTPPKTDSGIPLITAKVIKGGRIIGGNEEFIAEDFYDEWMRRGLPRQWDVLITTEAPLGEVAILRTSKRIALAQRVILLRGNPKKVDQQYLFFALQSPLVQGRLAARSTGTTVAGIKQSELRKVDIPVFELPTQRRIASILSAYDDLIENNTRRIAILEEMARRIYEEWFVRFRFPGHEQVQMVESELGLIPEGWKRGPISGLYAGLYDGPHATPKPSDEGPVFLGIGNITESGHLELSNVRHIAEEDLPKWTKRVFPKQGDIVFTYEATLNRYALIPKGFRGCLGRRLALIRTTPEISSNLFLYCTFFSQEWRTTIATNTLSGATVDRIPLSQFPTFKIITPPLEIITKFDQLVRPMFAQIEILGQKNMNLRTTRDLLLPKLISGEIDVSTLPVLEPT